MTEPRASRTEIERAAATLRSGGLVGFPTETVYGLGADAMNPRAVARIFAVKRRPVQHPLIVHLAEAPDLQRVAIDVPPTAWRLAERFWPGPLTLVLVRHPELPAAVTGGQDTVAVRVPDHPVALDLLRAFGGPVAAPSANRFGGVSPTTAEHVRADLGSDVDCVLDGGACRVGLESTIVDLGAGTPRVLRRGGLSEAELSAALGDSVVTGARDGLRTPGDLPSHYAPAARVVLAAPDGVERALGELSPAETRIGVLAPEGTPVPTGVLARLVPPDPDAYARLLYATLRELDASGCELVIVVPPVAEGVGRAVLDRLERAAAPRPDDLLELGERRL